MPIKDKEKAKQYFKEYMAKRRQALTVKPKLEALNQDVKPLLNSEADLLNPSLVKPVKPELENVKPLVDNFVKPEKEVVKPCSGGSSRAPRPCSNCLQLEKEKQSLEWEVNDCNKRHTIPKEAEFVDLMWDRRFKKFVFYACADSCWTGKYCNICSSLEQKIIQRLKQK